MCGIGGGVLFEGGEIDAAGLHRMGQVMTVRGPDDEGLFIVLGACISVKSHLRWCDDRLTCSIGATDGEKLV